MVQTLNISYNPINKGLFESMGSNNHLIMNPESKTSFAGYHIENPVFAKHEMFINYRKNNKNDLFLKQMFLKRLHKANINLPPDVNLEVIAPRGLTEKMRNTLKLIIFGEFKGYTNYFFDLMSQPKKQFDESILKLKITPDVRSKLEEIYSYLDDYYTLNLKLSGDSKSYNLIALSDKDKTELLSKTTSSNKAFLQAVIAESDNLREVATKFSRSEIERETLYEAGESSRNFIYKLIIGIAVLMGLDHYKDYLVHFLGPQTMMGKSANKITEFVGGCGDDCLGSYKDYFQDEVTLGKRTAQAVLAASMVAGVLTSVGAAKVGVGTLGGAILYGNASSGSSYFSNLATFVLMYRNFDKMVEKGLIELPEENMSAPKRFFNRIKTVWKNYEVYDAYWGKILGLIACTPAAIIAFKTGAFTKGKAKPFVYAAALTIVGSIESYTAMIVQLLRDNVRKAKIMTSKEIAVNQKIAPEDYNSRHYEFNNISKTAQRKDSFKNFFKSFG